MCFQTGSLLLGMLAVHVLNPCPSVVGCRKTSLTASVRVLIALMGLLCDNSECNGSCVGFAQPILLVLKPEQCGCAWDRWECGLSPVRQETP